MYELIRLSEHDYFIDCPAKIGLVRINDRDVILIDSGSDKDAGKKVIKILDENGMTMSAQQYVLIGSTVRSYLSSMYSSGMLEFEFANNRMIWKKRDV